MIIIMVLSFTTQVLELIIKIIEKEKKKKKSLLQIKFYIFFYLNIFN